MHINIPNDLKLNGLFCKYLITSNVNDPKYKKPLKANGYFAKPNDLNDWIPYNDIVASLKQNEGIGILLNGKLCCIDIDHCINDNIISNDVANDLIELLKSYTEQSQSGTGIHILFYVDIEEQNQIDYDKFMHHSKSIEFYCGTRTTRYICLTGNRINDYDIKQINFDVVMQILEKYCKRPQQIIESKADAQQINNIVVNDPMNDAEFLKIGLSKDSELQQLCNDTAHTYNDNESESSQDIKLFNKLAYWCNCNRDLMIQAFEGTPYFKTKDKKHLDKWARADYQKMTIDNAITCCRTTARESNAKYNNNMGKIAQKIDFNATLSLCDSILQDRAKKRVKTGFKQLDALLNGGFESGYITIGALASVGKTTFALQIADNIALHHNDVLFVAMEQNAQTLIRKSISRLTNNGFDVSLNYADVEQIQDAPNDKIESFKKAMAYYQNNIAPYMHFVGIGTSYQINDANDIIQAIEQIKMHTGKKPFVVVDYLQLLLKPQDTPNDAKSIIDANIGILSKYANNNQICIVGISAMNRKANEQDNATLGVYNGTSLIEYSSQYAINLIQDQENKANPIRNIDVFIAKNKNGVNNIHLPFTFYAEYNKFVESKKEEQKTDAPILKIKK